MKSKKGSIEIQFSWIFILIAGALIVAFFIIIVQKQKQLADVKLSGDIKADLSTILTGSRVSRGTSSLIEIPQATIYYDCDGYSVGNLGAINPGITFSPDTLKGTGLMMWSLDWNVPFRVDNFLYITSPEIRYIFVTDTNENIDTSVFSTIFESEDTTSFPPKTIIHNGDEQLLFNKENASWQFIMQNNFPNSNNYKIRFIYKDNPNPTDYSLANFFGEIPNDAVTAVNIKADTSCNGDIFDCFGKVQFYQKDNLGFNDGNPSFLGESYYLGRASVIAAVFAEKPEPYNCQMKKAFRKLQFVAQIYFDKANDLQMYYAAINDLNCQPVINTAKPTLQALINTAGDLANNFPTDADTKIADIYDRINSLETLNNNLQRLSCAEIY